MKPSRHAPRRDDLRVGWDFVAAGLVLPLTALLLNAAGVGAAADPDDLLARLPYGMVILALVWHVAEGQGWGFRLRHDGEPRLIVLAGLRRSALHVLPLAWIVLLTGRAAEAVPGLFLLGWLVLALLWTLPRLPFAGIGSRFLRR
ncbi:MAG: hypothetical protein KDG89_15055 [Geminicoccaceae bacterium]|nr:hypothetical protein [Geminicoccaceae bacterium]